MALKSVRSIGNNLTLSNIPKRNYTVYPQYLNNSPIPKLTLLPSGIKVASAESTGDLATVGVYIDSGSGNESENNNGVSNLFQNVVLKGSKFTQLQKQGVSLHGNVNRERTSIVAQFHKSDTANVVSTLSEGIQQSSFKDEDVQNARSCVLKTLQSLKHNFNYQTLVDVTHSAAFQGSSYAASPLGDISSVKKLTVDDLFSYHKTFVTAPNVVVVGTGAIKHEELVSLVEKNLASLPRNPAPAAPSFLDFVGSEMRIRDDTFHKARAVVAFQVANFQDPSYWATRLLRVVGEWKKSHGAYLFHSTRLGESAGLYKLGEEYTTFFTPYKSTGIFGIYYETSEEKLEDFTYAAFNEFQKLATYITPPELERAKNQLKTEVLSASEKPVALADSIAESVTISGRNVSLLEKFKRIDELQVQDVVKVITDYLTDVDPVVVAFGTLEDLPDYNIMRGWTYWNRW